LDLVGGGQKASGVQKLPNLRRASQPESSSKRLEAECSAGIQGAWALVALRLLNIAA